MFRAWLNSGYKRHAMPQTAHRSNTYMQRGIFALLHVCRDRCCTGARVRMR